MTPKWFVQRYETDGAINRLIDTLKELNIEYEVEERLMNESGVYGSYDDDDCVVVAGTINMCNHIIRSRGWVPGVYCNFQNFNCVTYYSHWHKYLLSSNYIMVPFMDLANRTDFLFSMYGVDDCIFIRPDSSRKVFTGQVLEKEEIDSFVNQMVDTCGKPLDETVIVVTTPKVIDYEWRVVVVNKKVVSGSQYHKDCDINISPDCPQEALDLAQEIANDKWSPDFAYVLDICLSNGKYYLLEPNSFSCSGLYDNDMKPIIEAINKVALAEWKDYNEV